MKKILSIYLIFIFQVFSGEDLENGIKWKADCGCAVDHIKSSNSDNYKENVGRFAYGKLLLMKLDYMFKRREKGIMRMIATSKNDKSGIKSLSHRRIFSDRKTKVGVKEDNSGLYCDKADMGVDTKISIRIKPDKNPNNEFEQESLVQAIKDFKEKYLNVMEIIKKIGNENTILDTYQLAKTVSMLEFKNFKKWETRDIAKRLAKESLDYYLTNFFGDESEMLARTEKMDPIERADIIYFMDVFKGVIYSIQKDLFPAAAKKPLSYSYEKPLVMDAKQLAAFQGAAEKGRAQDFSLNKLLNKIAWENGEDCRLSFGLLTYEVTVELINGSTKYFYITFMNQPQTKQTAHSFEIHFWTSKFYDKNFTEEKVFTTKEMTYRKTNISFNSGANNIKDEFEHSCRITIVGWKTALSEGLKGLGFTIAENVICGKEAIHHPDDLPFMLDIPEIPDIPDVPEIPDIPEIIVEENKYYYQFNCQDFLDYLNSLASNSTAYNSLIQDLDGFATRKDASDEKVNPGELSEFLKNLPFYCLQEPDVDKDFDETQWSKKRKFPLHEKPEKYKTIGIIKYREKIILILRFWFRIKGEPDEEGNLYPSSTNTKMCFEIEDFLTENIKSYYECFKYPEVKIPSENIPFDFLFIIYQPILRLLYKKLKELNSRARYYIIPDEIYRYLFLYFRKENQKNTSKYILNFESQMIQTYDGIYREFRLEGFEYVFFNVIIYQMNSYYYRIILKTGFREFEFYIKRYVEDDFGKENESVQLTKKNFLEKNYIVFAQNFFDSVLYTHNQIDIKQIVGECLKANNISIDNFADSGLMMYFNTDLVSFPIIVVIIENLLLDLNFKKINLFRSKFEKTEAATETLPDLDPENIFISQIEFFFYTNKKAKKEEHLFPSFKWDSLVIDQIIENKREILAKTLSDTSYDYIKSKKNNYTLIYGMPESNRKMQIVIFTFEEGYAPLLLIKFSCQFFIHEFLIPYSSLYELIPTLKSIIVEMKKNLMSYLVYFNEETETNEQTEDLTAIELIGLIKEINTNLTNPLPLCMITLQKDEDPDFNKNLGKVAAKFYIKKNLLFENYFTEEKVNPEIKECDASDSFKNRNLAITLEYTAVHNSPGYSIQIIEPYKNRGFNTILEKAIEVSSYVKDKSMISDYKILKNYPFNHKHVVKIILKSALGHYLNTFDPIDQEMETKLEKFLTEVTGESI